MKLDLFTVIGKNMDYSSSTKNSIDFECDPTCDPGGCGPCSPCNPRVYCAPDWVCDPQKWRCNPDG